MEKITEILRLSAAGGAGGRSRPLPDGVDEQRVRQLLYGVSLTGGDGQIDFEWVAISPGHLSKRAV